MRKRLTRIGSSLGVMIDKPILDLLKITPETEQDSGSEAMSES